MFWLLWKHQGITYSIIASPSITLPRVKKGYSSDAHSEYFQKTPLGRYRLAFLCWKDPEWCCEPDSSCVIICPLLNHALLYLCCWHWGGAKRVRELILPLASDLLVTFKERVHLWNALSRWRHPEQLGQSSLTHVRFWVDFVQVCNRGGGVLSYCRQ